MSAAPNENIGGWEDFLDRSGSAGDGPAELELLVQVVLAHSKSIPASTFAARPGGVPAGRPSKAVAREAGARLIGRVPGPVDGTAGVQRILGLIASVENPSTARHRDRALWETPEARRTAGIAIAEAEAHGDPDILCWALDAGARFARVDGDHQGSLDLAERALAVALSCVDAAGPWAHGQAAGSPAWLPPDRIARRIQAAGSATFVARNRASLGQYEPWKNAVQQRRIVAEALREDYPRYLATALSGAVELAQVVGDRQSYLAIERELQLLVESTGSYGDTTRAMFAARSSNLAAARDWRARGELNRERLHFVLESVRAQAREGGVTAALRTVDEVVSFLHSRGDRAFSASIGNACLDQAGSLFSSGETWVDEGAVGRALDLLDTAERAYGEFGGNGFASTRLSRARILINAPTPRLDPKDATTEFLEVSRLAMQFDLRRNAVLEAARACVPGDDRVLSRIEEMLSGPASTHHPRLRAALTIWHYRAGQASPGTAEWSMIEATASEAAESLRIDGKFIDPLLSTDCWLAALDAHRQGDRRPDREVEISLHAVNSLAVHLLTVTHAEERSRVATHYAHVYPDAASLAISVGDTAAAEIIMEAARRERVGLLLGELSTNPAVGEAVQEAASRIVIANAAAPDIRDFKDRGTSRSWTVRSAADITANQAAAVAAAATVIGPASVLADFGQLPVLRAERIVRHAAEQGQAAAILQLYRPPASGSEDGRRLFWEVTYPDGEDAVSECGQTLLPVSASQELSLDNPGFWTDHHQLSAYLLPEPLRRYLLRARNHWPVRLTIIPTGLLGMPFDNLEVDPVSEVALIECSDIVFTGSLAMADALAGREQSEPAPHWLSVYDHTRLGHARTESDAMAGSHDPVNSVRSAAELHTALREDHTYEVFALGVHGTQDRTGWGQTKLLPDGSTVTAAEALKWTAPRYSMLSSCHTALETIEGSELSGFPAALLLRGSTTVIGSLHTIDDASTAGIMALCWQLMGTGTPPAHALAQAKRQWLEQHPDYLAEPWLWAPLITYGTH